MSHMNMRSNQSGIASITVTMIILGIVTLITVGFATLMRREQQQALDQQLSTQAFYAAESGVNAARDHIEATPIDELTETTECADSPVASDSQLSSTVAFSCVLIDTTPDSLKKTVPTDTSWVVKVQTEDPVNRLEISWQMPDSSTFANPAWSPTHLLLPANKWADTTGIVRLMLMPDSTSRATLLTRTYHAFLYPNGSNAASVEQAVPAGVPSPSQQGRFIDGNCDTSRSPHFCKVTLTGLTATSYFLRLKSIYNASNVTLRSYNSSNQPQEFMNGQAQIDSTGRAADVVRRIQVNVPLEESSIYPEFALESFTTLCKRFITWPTAGGTTGGALSDVASSNGTLPLSQAQQNACSP